MKLASIAKQKISSSIKPKTKSITAKSAGEASLRYIKSQFPAATEKDIEQANRPAKHSGPRKQYENFTYAGDGVIRKTDAKPSDGFFKQAKLRHKHVTPKLKRIKQKKRIFPHKNLVGLFLNENIAAYAPNGWTVMFNEPARKMTSDDQVRLFLADPDTEYMVHLNMDHKLLIIDELAP